MTGTQRDNRSGLPKPSGASGSMGTGCRLLSCAWPAVGEMKLCGSPPLPGREPHAATGASGPDPGHRVPWRLDCRPADRPLHSRTRARLTALPSWTCASNSKDGFRPLKDLRRYPGATPQLECDCPGMTSHAWCTGHVAGFANLHSNGRVLQFGVGTVGNWIGSANLCGPDMKQARTGQSRWPYYKMDLGLLTIP